MTKIVSGRTGKGVAWDSNRRTTTPKVLQTGGRYIYMRRPTIWLRAIDNHRLGSGARLEATDARNLPKPVKVTLRTRNKFAQTQNELLRWIKNLNPGLYTENRRILDKQPDPKGQRLILHIDRTPFWPLRGSDTRSLHDFHREELRS
jgi:hypothetical protein